MHGGVAPPPAEALSAVDPAQLREKLLAAAYDERVIAEAERVAPRQFDAVRLPVVHAWLERRGRPAHLLALVFSYQAAVSRSRLVEVLGAPLVAALERARVLDEAPAGQVVARYRLTPARGVLVLADEPHGGADVAMGPGPTTVIVADMVPEAPGEVLDVGCGAGTLALVAAARGARRAVGVDVNPRAVAVGRFNACLNGLSVEFKAGDLLEPVRGETFDLVLSQPPYVVRPDTIPATTYLHGGALGEELALRFASELPAALRQSGMALLHFDAPVLRGRSLVERLAAAVRRNDIDVVALTAAGPSPELQAVAYAMIRDPTLGPVYAEASRAYAAHLARHEVESFQRAVVVLRRAACAGTTLAAQLPARLEQLSFATLQRLLAALDLASRGDAELLAATLAIAPGARLVKDESVGPSPVEQILLRFDRGLATDQELNEATALLVQAFASPSTVTGAASAFAIACGAPEGEVLSQVLGFVRQGLARGVLDVAEGA